MKQVRYNGRKDDPQGVSDPNSLSEGKIYIVIEERESNGRKDYMLYGVEGEFNSVWFDVLKPVYYMNGKYVPRVGKAYSGRKTTESKGVSKKAKSIEWTTSTVIRVWVLGKNTYYVETKNSIYIVEIV